MNLSAAPQPPQPQQPVAALPDPPLQLVVMGVSGCGKSTIGAALAAAMGLNFIEGDTLHPPRNVALMAAGTPLTDADRAGWLGIIADRLAQAHSAGQGLVVSCSALKRRYRDQLRAHCPGLQLLHLRGGREQLMQRLQARSGHYMPASLLDSQLDTLELPAADEHALCFDVGLPAAQITAEASSLLRRSAATRAPLRAHRSPRSAP